MKIALFIQPLSSYWGELALSGRNTRHSCTIWPDIHRERNCKAVPVVRVTYGDPTTNTPQQ